eukprot:TRINITY_DN4933_c0_g2_i1.p1 TRINITY_DN4933_c0_g2~~TRINITY_DN4933_c0_g2_i1.p1  ORF type:complete len:747 (+),score=128.10 TRINITY_DN4933_c0_g2_i1:78-2243(+)
MAEADGIAICAEGGKGLMLPLLPGEHNFSSVVRAVLYTFGMAYMFLGIAMIADTFVQAIEKITSTRTQALDGRGMLFTKKIWNETVATLTLMALGSSAPEIALAVVDIFKKGFHYGSLGTSTIVGSAAFNLLVIIAVCIYVIPDERVIEFLPAFHVTAVFSILAYLWMCFVLEVSTPDIVDIWEAVFTLLLLPVLVYVSYKVDVHFRADGADGYFSGRSSCIAGEADLCVVAFAASKKEKRARKHAKGSTDTCIRISKKDLPMELTIPVLRDGNLDNSTKCYYSIDAASCAEGYDFSIVDDAVEDEKAQPNDEDAAQGVQAEDEDKHKADVDVGDDERLCLHFPPNCFEQSVKLQIPARASYKSSRKLYVVLDELTDAYFDPETDGGSESAVLTIILPPGGQGALPLLDHLFNFDMARKTLCDWREQIKACLYCNGSWEEQQAASAFDIGLHLVCLPWKIIFCAVPPTGVYNGWFAFVVCLGFIGLTSAIVSDLAELFGCVIGVPDEVTAITFVALGTSMPDLFASRESAVNDPTADASVVNVTGSNSVNVFLGLGVPWLFASIYWTIVGRTDEWIQRYGHITSPCAVGFVVQSRNITFMVLVFTVLALLASMILLLRRKWLGAELGGPYVPKLATSVSFVLYWVVFIMLCSWNGLYRDTSSEKMLWIVVGSGFGFTVLVTVVLVAVLKSYKTVLACTSESDADDHDGSEDCDEKEPIAAI